ncbi:MAG: low specificity L-threonine aldolase [Proteobacteria bacterium]|uniref:Low specificity L-threonine aldolase n=1 Tax=Candidatus Avisuccinivibrio stercorigallinarum TaxID=2840704 RepID=A0A9D9DEC2_9GAMM|nr:low specificity L-threonine aldolase [Candidatus Avisuccinivibrio stercorigallinarum]
MLFFENDYCAGAHPRLIERLTRCNLLKQPGYGTDESSEEARAKIRAACGLDDTAEIYLLCGGTQTNKLVIDSLLHKVQGVVAVRTGHVSLHEAGAVESSGHKVLEIDGTDGKMSALTLKNFLKNFAADENGPHMVQPGAVYISQPTEYGTLYKKNELLAIRSVCAEFHLKLYVDGARLSYALGSTYNDVSLKDLAQIADVFYIGGTKCGALFGEAVVFPHGAPGFFFTLMKQHGALMAKGFVTGEMFSELFTDDLYLNIGTEACRLARKLSQGLEYKGVELYMPIYTNQIFVVLKNSVYESIKSQALFSFWEPADDEHTVYRIAVSWATTEAEVDALLELF